MSCRGTLSSALDCEGDLGTITPYRVNQQEEKYFSGSGLVSLIKGLLLLPAVQAEFDVAG